MHFSEDVSPTIYSYESLLCISLLVGLQSCLAARKLRRPTRRVRIALDVGENVAGVGDDQNQRGDYRINLGDQIGLTGKLCDNLRLF